MSQLPFILLTAGTGVAAGLLLFKLKVPGGLLVGAMIGVAVLNIFTGSAQIPSGSRVLVQVIAGAFIGSSIEKDDLLRLSRLWKPLLIVMGSLLMLNLIAGLLIWKTGNLDPLTALMCAVPGGISDTPIIAADMGADGSKVFVMQLLRYVLGIGVLPSVIHFMDKKAGNAVTGSAWGSDSKRTKSGNRSVLSFMVTIGTALAAGLIGRATHLPASTFVFPIIAILILKLKFDFAFLPLPVKRIAQIISGCYLGGTISLPDVLELRFMLIPALILTAAYTVNCLLFGWLTSRICGYPLKEGLLINTPAGASDTALISGDLGITNTDIVVLQVIRAILVLSIFPQILHAAAGFLIVRVS